MAGDGRTVALAVALIGSTLLAGCREDEQGRMLMQDKGTYQGPADEQLTEDQVDRLRLRAREQRI